MKSLRICGIVGLTLALAGCADDSPISNDGRTGTEGGEVKRAAASQDAAPGEPVIQVPEAPPPRTLIVKDLRKGSGRVLKAKRDKIVVKYVGAYYRSGDVFYSSWQTGSPSRFYLEEVHKGWEIGLKGMRVGGRRELIEPSRLAYGAGAAIYVVDLLAVI